MRGQYVRGRGSRSRRRGLWLLLGSLVVVQFGYPITQYGGGWTILYLLFYAGMVAFGVRTVQVDPRRYWPIAVAAAALVVGGVWFALQQEAESALVAMLLGVGLMQIALLVILLGRLLSPPRSATSADLLLVAVCAYLLLGGVFGVGASLLELAEPGSYIDSGSGEPLTWQTLFYGSYVTLATLGFGDVVPIAGWARSLSTLEAVTGTLFVAVVIARLVGVARSFRRDVPDDH